MAIVGIHQEPLRDAVSIVLGLSHLCVGCTMGMDDVVNALGDSGYTIQFEYRELRNPPAKKTLVRQWTDEHEMRLLAAPGLPSIEILHHHNGARSNTSNYAPTLPLTNMGGKTRGVLSRYGIGVADHKAGTTNELLVSMQCQNRALVADFWRNALGFTCDEGEESGEALRLKALSPTWRMALRLEQVDEPVEPTYLDDIGCTCLSFLVRDINAVLDLCRLNHAKYIGEVFAMNVGGKDMSVAFVRGPQGELIEFILLG